jgi:2-polyprenyl-3-methyl-5-hydroxy-6-metoxy-1,4-benzoquinol methylase
MADSQGDARQELYERLSAAAWQSLELMTVYLGDQLGLYRALHTDGAATAPELARRAGIAERYALEWLEGQAASGFLTVDDVTAPPRQRRFALPEAYAEVFTDRDSPYSGAPLATDVGAIGPVLPRLLQVFRTGEGVPSPEYGPELVEAQGDFNRPWLKASLGREYLPSIPDVHQRLTSGPARVADLACGAGWAAIAIARAYPQVTVDGYDADSRAVELARTYAADEGLSGRVSFTVHDLSQPVSQGGYDLAIVIEAVHDLPRPVEFLRTAWQMLAPGGVAIVADEKAGETFTAPAHGELDPLLYAASVLSCLPIALADQPSAATGTVIRPGTMRRYATEAGFGRVEILDAIDHDALRFYRLDP